MPQPYQLFCRLCVDRTGKARLTEYGQNRTDSVRVHGVTMSGCKENGWTAWTSNPWLFRIANSVLWGYSQETPLEPPRTPKTPQNPPNPTQNTSVTLPKTNIIPFMTSLLTIILKTPESQLNP